MGKKFVVGELKVVGVVFGERVVRLGGVGKEWGERGDSCMRVCEGKVV